MTKLKTKFVIVLLIAVLIISVITPCISNANGETVVINQFSLDAEEVQNGTETISATYDWTCYNYVTVSKVRVLFVEKEENKFSHEVYMNKGKIDISNFEAGYTFKIESITFFNSNGLELKRYSNDTNDASLASVPGNKQFTIKANEETIVLNNLTIGTSEAPVGTTSVPVTIDYTGWASSYVTKIGLLFVEVEEKFSHEVYIENGSIDVSGFENGYTFEIDRVTFYASDELEYKRYYRNAEDENKMLSLVPGNKQITITSAYSIPIIKYRTHVQDYGTQDYVYNYELSGTTGQSKRLEAIGIEFANNVADNVGESIRYLTHVQDYGWQDTVSNGEMAGTERESKRLEAIRIYMTGKMANNYDIYYRVHAQDYGWLNWAKNGQSAGTEGLSKRLEAIQIQLVPKGGSAPGSTKTPFVKSGDNNVSVDKDVSISYTTHVQDYGWQNYISDGGLAGTTGESKRLEGIKIKLENKVGSGQVEYSTHVQDYGWQNSVLSGNLAGTTGESKRLEAIKIKLNGNLANNYDIYYKVHAQNFGWLNWAKNGEAAGTEGYAYRLEGIKIMLVPKGMEFGNNGSDIASFYKK